MTKKAQEYLDGWKRCKADFLNFKKEIQEQKKDWSEESKKEIIFQILPILDGLELLTKELKRCLNIKEVSVKKFDPAIHEAVSGKGERVTEIIQKGYKINKKLIRPAKVKLD